MFMIFLLIFLGAEAAQSRAPRCGMFHHRNNSNFITISCHYEFTLGRPLVRNMLHCNTRKCSDVRGRRNCAIAALCSNNGINRIE